MSKRKFDCHLSNFVGMIQKWLTADTFSFPTAYSYDMLNFTNKKYCNRNETFQSENKWYDRNNREVRNFD